MPELCLIFFYSITTLVLSRSISCARIICYNSPFPELCNSIIVPKFESHESQIKASMSQAHNLSMTSDDRLIQLAEGGEIKQVDLVVAQDGSGDFSTVVEAIKASENRRTGTDRFIIYVKSGVYIENVIINSSMHNLTLIGEGIDATVITNNKNVNDGYETYNTATFQIWGSGFVAIGITFENTAGPEKLQAVALLSASDLSAFFRCSFKGYQDTLCLFQQRQFYRECDIYGTVDFIFGDAIAVLQDCNIYLRKPLFGQQNTITAQGRTDSSSATGFVIHNSQVTAAPGLTLADGSVKNFLGRPWRDYSRVVFVKCNLDSLIDPQGWMPYRDSSAFDKLYYAEAMNSGEGANTSGRVRWPGFHVLTGDQEAEQFSVRNFLAGDSWIPQTGIPFDSETNKCCLVVVVVVMKIYCICFGLKCCLVNKNNNFQSERLTWYRVYAC
uniref:Pectinesterase n=1 Tax=Lactuca sativa TaxID=4236 RepID=A0A9R1W591_LACSA|nr:hypothetical protein LSAT_V11C300109590 [Lactuca sativa]